MLGWLGRLLVVLALSVEQACVLLSTLTCLVIVNSSGGDGVCIDADRMRLFWLSIIRFVFTQL